MPCLRYGMLLPQGRHQDKSIALIATYYKGWNNAGDRPYVLGMPTRHYGVVVPESQKVPCIISTYQRAYGSRTTDRPYVLEVMDA